eukprot:gb/GEZN01019603.1/.p1 GENE.gb/GEZN01019603.1/~~gb/GEZN01019603.1/.p1  ORF type:complete len:220 (-),score=18.47 gb/GEZN01019603.1/:53-691(-)
MFHLGLLHENEGVDEGLKKAILCYEQAVKQGHSEAMFHLGLLLERGEGVEKDYSKAAQLYSQAGELGHLRASANAKRLAPILFEINTSCRFVQEEILTLKCPNPTCRQAWLDFSHCFSLMCSSCGSSFCAWCLEMCDRDNVNRHVCVCRYNLAGGVSWGTSAQFEASNRTRRLRNLQTYLQTQKPEIRLQVLFALQVSLRHLCLDDHQFTFT